MRRHIIYTSYLDLVGEHKTRDVMRNEGLCVIGIIDRDLMDRLY